MTKGKTLVSEGKTLVTKGKTLVIPGKTLVIKGKNFVTKRMTLVINDSVSQILNQRGLAKLNQLPAGPREKWPIGRLFSSIRLIGFYMQNFATISRFDLVKPA